MIKRSLITLTALITLATGSITAQAAPQDLNTEHLYPTTFIVYEIDKEYDIIYLTTSTGFEYIWEGVEDWRAGDMASGLMYDNGTAKITDDEIIKLHYTGFNIYE